nr:unnamed protein product [Callosobruchus analis]
MTKQLPRVNTEIIQDVSDTKQNTDRVIQVHKAAKDLHGEILDTMKNVLQGAKHLRDVNCQTTNDKIPLGNKEAVKEFVELNNDSKELLSRLKNAGDLQFDSHHLKTHYQELQDTQQLIDKLNECHNLFRELCMDLKKRSRSSLQPAHTTDTVRDTTISSVNSSELEFSREKLPSSSPYQDHVQHY